MMVENCQPGYELLESRGVVYPGMHTGGFGGVQLGFRRKHYHLTGDARSTQDEAGYSNQIS